VLEAVRLCDAPAVVRPASDDKDRLVLVQRDERAEDGVALDDLVLLDLDAELVCQLLAPLRLERATCKAHARGQWVVIVHSIEAQGTYRRW